MNQRSYEVRTHGCQMNVHDSERLSGLLEDAGTSPRRRRAADVVVFNTCAVRENADNKLYGNLGHLRRSRRRTPACRSRSAAASRRRTAARSPAALPGSTSVFGTHNIGSLPALLERARHNAEAQVEIVESLEVFPSTLPTRRESPYAAWVSVSVGCNNTCTFCIVPACAAPRRTAAPATCSPSRGAGGEGVLEVTLLGQNVNSYGVEFGDRLAFGQAAARLRRDRRPRAGSLHQPAPPRTSPTT
jgi:tRNA-2-methylthio-N6-dimethylallyladenosine synthase